MLHIGENLGLLELVDAGLTINKEEISFVMKEIRDLGYSVGEKGLRPDSKK